MSARPPVRISVAPSRRRRRPRRALVLAALAGVGAAALVAGFWIPVKAELAQQLLNRAWAATREATADQAHHADRADSADRADRADRDRGKHAERTPQRPWPWADTWPVARLTLPVSERPLTVLAGASGRNLAFGPALMDGSAMPGTAGVSVIAGHRDTHFRELGKLAIGDRFEIELPDGASFVYEVAEIDVIDAARTMVRLDAEGSIVMLVTCYPFEAVAAGGSLRYVVVAYVTQGLGR